MAFWRVLKYMPKIKQYDHFGALKLANELIADEIELNIWEHKKLDLLAGGNPILTDVEFAKLKILSEKIWAQKKTLARKTLKLKAMKKVHYQKICHQINAARRNSRKLVISEYGEETE